MKVIQMNDVTLKALFSNFPIGMCDLSFDVFINLIYNKIYPGQEATEIFTYLNINPLNIPPIYNEFIKSFYLRYNEQIIVSYPKGTEGTGLNSIYFHWFSIFSELLKHTQEYYLPLFTFYEANKNKLLDQVKATQTNITRFNDTPQNEGDFANDEHTTNITQSQSKSASDVTTIMSRLQEIQDGYKRLLYDWVNEFSKIFIEEVNEIE